MYLVKTPWWLRALYPSFVWRIKTASKELYLTFDDGPHPIATPFVLNALAHYNAKATFFCIGKNVLEHSGIFHRVIAEGHRIGNHTHNHINGWQTDDKAYNNNILQAAGHINSNLFRPPYGRIKRSQVKDQSKHYKIIMWDILSGDFDTSLQPQKSLGYVIRFSGPGSIIVFHDSAKAFKTLQFVLPKVLDHFFRLGYVFKTIP